MEAIHRFITFASEADILALWGAGFLLLSVIALLAERMRMKRAQIDRVGWIPWTQLFLISAVIGGGLLALSVPAMLQG